MPFEGKSFFNLGAEKRKREAEKAPQVELAQVVRELDDSTARSILSEIEMYKRLLEDTRVAGGDVSPEDRETFRQLNERIDALLASVEIEFDEEGRQEAYDALQTALADKLKGPAQEAA